MAAMSRQKQAPQTAEHCTAMGGATVFSEAKWRKGTTWLFVVGIARESG